MITLIVVIPTNLFILGSIGPLFIRGQVENIIIEVERRACSCDCSQ